MSDEPDDYSFFQRADFTAEEIEDRIATVLGSGKPSRRFLELLRLMFDRRNRKGVFKAKVQRRKTGRPKGVSKSAARAAIARDRLRGAKRGEVEAIRNAVAEELHVTPKTLANDLRKAKYKDEAWEWIQEKN